jgi:hypothetical protein
MREMKTKIKKWLMQDINDPLITFGACPPEKHRKPCTSYTSENGSCDACWLDYFERKFKELGIEC